MKTIKLMPDYDCFPLWEASPGQVGNLAPDALPLSQELRAALLAWARTYDATLNRGDPLSSGFPSAQAESAFKQAGHGLARRLQAELGHGWQVVVALD